MGFAFATPIKRVRYGFQWKLHPISRLLMTIPSHFTSDQDTTIPASNWDLKFETSPRQFSEFKSLLPLFSLLEFEFSKWKKCIQSFVWFWADVFHGEKDMEWKKNLYLILILFFLYFLFIRNEFGKYIFIHQWFQIVLASSSSSILTEKVFPSNLHVAPS